MDLFVGVICYAGKNISEISERLHLVQFGSRYQGINGRRPFGSIMRAGKQVILSPQRHRANGILNQVVIDFHLTIRGIAFQPAPKRVHISDGLSDLTAGQNLSHLPVQPVFYLP